MSDLKEIENLIDRIALGDRAAFSLLYDRTSAKLLGVALRIIKDRAQAEDILQDTFIKVWRNADRYASNGTSPMTWLITIARNTAIDRWRAKKPMQDDTALQTVAAKGPTPEQSAVATSDARQIVACLDELDADRGAAVRGAYLDGQSYADLADRFDVPLNTMRTWLRRSLIALRECMSR